MKTKMIIPALFVVGLCGAPLMAPASSAHSANVEFVQDADKVRVEKDRLPESVKEAIKKDKKSSEAEFTEAWQMRGEDGKVYYSIKFNHNGEEFSKKYDAEGNEKRDN